MSNHKGNNIQSHKNNKKILARSMTKNAADYKDALLIITEKNREIQEKDLKICDLLEKDERSTAEIARLKKLTSDYGTICKDCNRGTDNQLKLTKANQRLKTLNNWACIALGIAAVTIMLLMRGK